MTEEELLEDYKLLYSKWTILIIIYTKAETKKGRLKKYIEKLLKIVEDRDEEIKGLNVQLQALSKGIKMMNSSTNILEEILVMGKNAKNNTGIGYKKGKTNNQKGEAKFVVAEEDDIGEPINAIVDEKVRDSSCVDAAYLLEYTVVPSATASMGKTIEPSNVYVNVGDVSIGVDNPEGITVNVSSVDDNITNASKQASVENFGKAVDPNVKDTVDGLKENPPIGADEGRPTVINTGNDTAKDENVTPSVRDTTMEDAAEPTVGKGDADTLNTEEMEILEDASQKKKKSKKRKHKKVVEEQVPPVDQPTVSNEWLPEQEQPGDEVVQDYDDEDIAAIISRRRKAKRKLKIIENRSKVGNKRIPKNVAAVSTGNVALNFEEEEAKWKFVASRRIAAERMLSEVTKKNTDMMDILADVGVRPKLVGEFICNMTYDIDEPESTHFQKVTLRNRTVEFCPSIINAYYGRANAGKTGAKLQLSEITKVLTGDAVDTWPDKGKISSSKLSVNIIEAQQPDILTVVDEEAPSPVFITISPKLLQGTHVANIPLRSIEMGSGSGAAQKSVLEARLRSLTEEDDPAIDPDASESEAEAFQE
ncbi:hypothetical protein LIER_35979 [Lithospermum erythrorhizon]|uniref:Envelope-like protein n=1 Tax=Lithospermum erythrorhizon TaxID=34254 RepID=A0AAV3P1Q8_LITER